MTSLIFFQRDALAGYREPIDTRAFHSESVALALHHPTEWVPYTVSVSIELLRRSQIVLVVLPTEGQVMSHIFFVKMMPFF